MASGIGISENYNPWWPLTGAARLLLSTDLPDYLQDHRSVYFEPGTQAEYRSVDTQMLSMILTEIDGRPLAQIVAEDLWSPMGASADATWNLDSGGGIEKGFCCLNATATDFARIGQLVLDDGAYAGEQIIPERWIERFSTPSDLPSMDGWGYSAQWWHPPVSSDDESLPGDFTALGVYGQYIYINPDTGTVIVKLSDHGTEQDEIDTINAFRHIANHLGG